MKTLELLENVLLNVYARERNDCNLPRVWSVIAYGPSTRQVYFQHGANCLFIFRRVHSRFCSSILGSLQLGYLIGLDMKRMIQYRAD